MDLYHIFIAATLILWIFSTPRDRNALRIVLIASLASEVIVDEITHQIQGAWKLVIPSGVEFLTIMALLKWARNRTGIAQAALLVVAWLAHLLCYVDIYLQSDIVYSRYETIIYLVSAGQLATCYDTMLFNLTRVFSAAAGLWTDCFLVIRHPSIASAVSVDSAGNKVSAIKRECEANHTPPLITI